MDSTDIITLLAFGLSLATFVVIRLNRRDEIADEIAYGDYPHLPEGMTATRRKTGGRGCNGGQRPGTHRVIAHDKAGQ